MSETPAIEFALTRSKADFFPATLAMMRRTRVPVMVLLVFIVVLATLYMGQLFRGSPAQAWVAMATTLGVGLYSVAVWLLVCYFVARRGWSAPGALNETRYVFSDAGVWGEAQNIESKTGWEHWKSAFTTPHFLIIASHTGQWMFFPRSALGLETFSRLEALTRAKLERSAARPATRSAS